MGTVILGVAAHGAVKKHDAPRVLPGTRNAQVRSIQKHDDDLDSASEGDRVGLILKNVEVEKVDRGTVLTTNPTVKAHKTLVTYASLVRYWSTPIKAGIVLHLGHWMQFLNCKVEAVNDEGDWR